MYEFPDSCPSTQLGLRGWLNLPGVDHLISRDGKGRRVWRRRYDGSGSIRTTSAGELPASVRTSTLN